MGAAPSKKDMATPKLYYLPLRARAEPIKMILHFGKVKFEDIDVTFADWPAMKSANALCHFGALPSMITPSGAVIGQSGAIIRYAAKLASVSPADPEECAVADMLVELAQDMNGVNPVLNFFDPASDMFKAAKAAYFAALPARMEEVSKILGSKDFFGGKKPHYGDFTLFHVLFNTLTVDPSALEKFPTISAWCSKMRELPGLKEYLATRAGPKTPGYGKPGTLIMSMEDAATR
jgi:glutathione S-transferase